MGDLDDFIETAAVNLIEKLVEGISVEVEEFLTEKGVVDAEAAKRFAESLAAIGDGLALFLVHKLTSTFEGKKLLVSTVVDAAKDASGESVA